MNPTHTTGSLAAALGAELLGRADLPITGVEALDLAGPASLTFIRSASFAAGWSRSRAGAALVSRGVAVPGHDPASRALLVVPDADLALVRMLELFAPPARRPAPGVHPSAAVDPSAALGAGVSIGAHCTVGPGARVGDGSVLHAGVYLGPGAGVGRMTTVHPRCTILDRCEVGDGCILWPGVVIGADGFGYRPAPDGRGLVKIPHIGTVRIGRAVEIGANSCIDRAKFGATIIGDGTKIDNLVQIGHNCVIGRACIICGQAAIAGSVTLGDGVILGGAVAIADGVTIGAGARVVGNSGVPNSIPAGETWMGYPTRPSKETARIWGALPKLPDLLRRVRLLEHSAGLGRYAATPPSDGHA